MKNGTRVFDLPVELMREHSKRNIVRVTRWVGDDAHRFAMLMELVLNGEETVSRRASWVMSVCVERSPALSALWIRQLFGIMDDELSHPAVKRNTIRSLQFIDIPSRSRGHAVDLCITILRSVRSEIAEKAYAMTVLQNIVKKEPDLRDEAVLVIEPLMEYGSAGVRSRARKVMKALKALKSLRI